ncbi:hypothetical protein [Mangrovivirga cuniculi]|uniref:Erythromycin esterase n=1 Tax=Mangrovivirga cuniculi TaxID=2715131 RepID=A0A4D7JJM9_9BACT|nr:hypothetical protein [Mangrovivirga cuniculi]QCK16169.1 hypothetical protein DCC35_16175 [Mangrovivirga cuniculi]
MKYIIPAFILITVWSGFKLRSQNKLLHELNNKAFHFSLTPDYRLEGDVAEFLNKEVRSAQFVGLAELHRSEQLSLFTVAFLDLLAEANYHHLALETGPYSAEFLEKSAIPPEETQRKTAYINRAYGNRLFGSMVPIIFVDREEDALFIKKASEEGFDFWGLDQEFANSFEMHLDSIYSYNESPGMQLQNEYYELKKIIHKMIRKSNFSLGYSYYCELYEHEGLKRFFNEFNDIPEAANHIDHFYTSLDIYCKSVRGKNSNQQRADYMKSNFEKQYEKVNEEYPKVFVKLGSVHLTRGKSPFGVNDVGQFLREKAEQNNTGFLTIRHLRRYKNGKDYTGKKGWEDVSNFMKAGEKKRWTLIDLRPVRDKIEAKKLEVTEREKFEIYSYDLLLIPPNDHTAKKNF